MTVAESEFTDPRPECPNPERWTAEDDQITENEVMDLVWGLIRALQPDYILETGSYNGKMAAKMADAATKNGHGRVVTIESDEKRYKRTVECVYPVARPNIECVHCSSLDFEPGQDIDFAWIDTDAPARFMEFAHFYPYMHNRTIVCFHDTGIQHYNVREHVIKLTEDGVLVPVFLPTPRGVAICQVFKNHESF